MLRRLLVRPSVAARPAAAPPALGRKSFFQSNLSPTLLKSSFGPRHYSAWRQGKSRWSRWGGNRQSSSRFWTEWKVPLLFSAVVLGASHLVLPPLLEKSGGLRRHPEYLVYGIMGINGAVFLLWKAPAAQQIMNRYFLLQKHPSRFNAWSIIGSAFSHQELWHLGINMFVLYQFGIPVARWLGASDFITSYMDSCVLASLGSLMIPHLLRGAGLMLPSLGASGAIYSVVGIFSYLAPNAKLAFLFIPLPFGAWYVFLAGVGYNAFQLARRAQTGYDYAGHLAGALSGILLGWFAVEKNRRRRAERRAARPSIFR